MPRSPRKGGREGGVRKLSNCPTHSRSHNNVHSRSAPVTYLFIAEDLHLVPSQTQMALLEVGVQLASKVYPQVSCCTNSSHTHTHTVDGSEQGGASAQARPHTCAKVLCGHCYILHTSVRAHFFTHTLRTALGKRTSNHDPATAPPGSHRAVARRGCLCRWPTTSWCGRWCQSHFRQRVRHNVLVLPVCSETNKRLTHIAPLRRDAGGSCWVSLCGNSQHIQGLQG